MPTAVDRIVGFTIAAICMTAGLLLAFGLIPLAAPVAMRRTFGVLLVLVGLNRYVATRLKSRRRRSRWLSIDEPR